MASISSRGSAALAGVALTGTGTRAVQWRVPARSMRRQAVASLVYDPASVDPAQVKPQGDRLLVRLDKAAETSTGGVLLPSSAVKYDIFLTGQVIAAGPEAKSAELGQKVMFSDLNGYPVQFGSKEDKLCFVKDGDLLAIVE